METANIGTMTVDKNPGDIVNGSCEIHYTGNVPFTILVQLYICDNTGLPYTAGLIIDDEREWQPDQTSTLTDSIVMPDLPAGMYGGLCIVKRSDNDQILDSLFIPDMVQVIQRKIFGYVKNDYNTGINGAFIELNGTTTYSGVGGYYEITNLPQPGEVKIITASFSGYTSKSQSVMMPDVGEQVQVDFVLVPQSITAEITSFTIT